MRLPLRCFLFAACLLTGALATGADEAKPSPDAAKTAALAWLKFVDDGKYQDSWKEASSYFRAMVTQEKWVEALTRVRDPLGSVDTRTFKSAEFTHDLPRFPKGDYWVIQFATTFDGTETIETVTPVLDTDGKWHISVYTVKAAK